MKTIIALTAAALMLCAVSCTKKPATSTATTASDTTAKPALDTTKLARGATYYQCPMHPEITSDKPGQCPTCGMDLEQREKK